MDSTETLRVMTAPALTALALQSFSSSLATER
jgi:hypothetical protein